MIVTDARLPILDFAQLDEGAQRAALARPLSTAQQAQLTEVEGMIAAVRTRGDAAVRELAQRFDGVAPESLRISAQQLDAAVDSLAVPARAALQRAIDNVHRFHLAQRLTDISLETEPGVLCERILRPIERVGLYVPGGSAPLPSALIMSAVPATIAGCGLRILCTPARGGKIAPVILAAARLCGIEQVFAVGGVQAIAAMAYGTESIPKVDKIFGPGSSWVTAAKQAVAQDPAGAAIDLPAGPSEVMVIADDTADARFVAADLLAQAEHDSLSQAILLTPCRALADEVRRAALQQLSSLSRQTVLEASLQRSRILQVRDLAQAVELANTYAPEHLLLQVRDPRAWLAEIRSAGSVFLGPWSPEPMGDYCSGTNHVLPTYGYARAYSGLSLLDFQKRITVQQLTPAGMQRLGPTACTLAELEGLDAHALAVRLRLERLAELGAKSDPSP